MSIQFNGEKAMNADGAGIINEGGIYKGIITMASVFVNESGAGGMEFEFESVDGANCKFLKVYTKNRDGSENFAMGKIHSLMGLLNIGVLHTTRDINDDIIVPDIMNRKIALMLQRRDYLKNDGDIGFNMQILHFLDFQTLKTYKELKENKEAVTCRKEINDERLRESISVNNSNNQLSYNTEFNKTVSNHIEDDLPF